MFQISVHFGNFPFLELKEELWPQVFDGPTTKLFVTTLCPNSNTTLNLE